MKHLSKEEQLVEKLHWLTQTQTPYQLLRDLPNGRFYVHTGELTIFFKGSQYHSVVIWCENRDRIGAVCDGNLDAYVYLLDADFFWRDECVFRTWHD